MARLQFPLTLWPRGFARWSISAAEWSNSAELRCSGVEDFAAPAGKGPVTIGWIGIILTLVATASVSRVEPRFAGPDGAMATPITITGTAKGSEAMSMGSA